MISRTDTLIRAAVRALEVNREVLDALPDSLASVQLDIKIGKLSLPFSVAVAPRWANSLALVSVGKPLDVESYNFST